MDGILALCLWDIVIEVLRSTNNTVQPNHNGTRETCGRPNPKTRRSFHQQNTPKTPIETRKGTPASHEIVLSVAISASQCPRKFSLVTLISFHCLLRPAEARQLRWCDRKKVSWIPVTTLRKVYGVVNIRETKKTRKMAGHAAEQRVLLECHGTCQLVSTMKSSVPDHRLDVTIWEFTAARHTLHGLRGGGATDHWRQRRDLPQLRRRGRWTSDVCKKALSYSTKTRSPKKLQTVSVLSQSLRLVSLQSKTTSSPANSTCRHHVETESVEEVTPFCAAASSNSALPTPSCLSERYLYHLVTWHRNKGSEDDAHYTSTDTLGWIMSPHADGGRVLELLFFLQCVFFWFRHAS